MTVDGVAVKATVGPTRRSWCRSAGSCRPAASTTVRVRYGADLRSEPGRLELAVHEGERHRRTCTAGCRGSAARRLRPAEPRRSVRDPVEPARPGHGSSPTASSCWPRPATGSSTSADGLTQTFEARNVRDFTVTAATDYRTRSRTVGDTDRPRLSTGRAHPAPRCSMPRRTRSRRIEARLGAYPYPVFQVVQSAGGYGMESPGLIWIPTGAPRRTCATSIAHETAHQWFYGLVGNDQAREPFADEAAADFVARYVTGTQRGSRCPTGRLDLSIYEYTSRVLLRDGLHPGRQPARRRPQEDGLDGVLGGAARVRGGPPVRPELDDGRCSTRSTRRRRWTSAGRCSRRGSRGSTERPGRRSAARARRRSAAAPSASAGTRRAARAPGSPARHQPGRRRAAAAAPHGKPYASRTDGGQQPDRRPQGPVVQRGRDRERAEARRGAAGGG